MIKIHSIQVGQVITEGDPDSRDVTDRLWTSAFNKQPVSGSVKVSRVGIIGDAVADTRAHGGPDKAMLCYARSHYRAWMVEHPELAVSNGEIAGGSMGENLTINGADESDVCIGDIYDAGGCRLQVSQPRQPCWKISRRWGVKTLTKEVTQTGRTGWYVRVLDEGELQTGDVWRLIDRPNPSWSIQRANDLKFGRVTDQPARNELMNLSELAEGWKDG